MRRSLLFLQAVALVCAQDSTSAGSSVTASASYSAESSASTNATATSSGPITHTVAVAKGGFTYEPDVTLAEVGDTIEFQFYPTNHSVIRAQYGYACVPYEDTGVDLIGFYSGFKPVDAILPDPPSWSIRINDSEPVFYYCGAPGSCIDHQMVGVINPNATTPLGPQKQNAKDSTFMLLPGQPWPSEEQDPFTTSGAAATSTPSPTSTPSSAPAATSTSASSSHSHSGLSSGAIAGIAIGAAAVALSAAIALFLCGRQTRHLQTQEPTPVMQHQVPFSPQSNSHMSVYDPAKHMSMQSNAVSSALPGYYPVQNPHDSMTTGSLAPTSPPLHPSFAPSDALLPGGDLRSGSTSPAPMQAVPEYSQSHPNSMVMNSQSPFGVSHEMPAGVPAQLGSPMQQNASQSPRGSGIMGFIRQSSVGKSGGVERYG